MTALNLAARQHRTEAGELAAKHEVPIGICDGDGTVIDTHPVCAGDKVIATRNSTDLLNGQHGEVRTTHHNGDATIAVTDARGTRLVRLDAEDLATGQLALGYALTGHRAQGVTVDTCHVLADAAMTRQWGYSTMTRGRQSNELTFVIDPDRNTEPEEQLAQAWMRDDLEHTATAVIAGHDRTLQLGRAA